MGKNSEVVIHHIANINIHGVSTLLDCFLGVSSRVRLKISHRHTPHFGQVSRSVVVLAHVEPLWVWIDDFHVGYE